MVSELIDLAQALEHAVYDTGEQTECDLSEIEIQEQGKEARNHFRSG